MSDISLPVFDCDRCGACCRELILEADHLDALREPRIAAEATLLDGHGTIDLEHARWGLNRRGEGFACVFLGADNACGIYGTRPGLCVSHQAGSKQCQLARAMAKLPPLAPVTREPAMVDRLADLARRGMDEDSDLDDLADLLDSPEAKA